MDWRLLEHSRFSNSCVVFHWPGPQMFSSNSQSCQVVVSIGSGNILHTDSTHLFHFQESWTKVDHDWKNGMLVADNMWLYESVKVKQNSYDLLNSIGVAYCKVNTSHFCPITFETWLTHLTYRQHELGQKDTRPVLLLFVQFVVLITTRCISLFQTYTEINGANNSIK